MQKQFEYKKPNAKGIEVKSAMAEFFNSFEEELDETFLKAEGKNHRCHGLMIECLEQAQLYAQKALMARPDVKQS